MTTFEALDLESEKKNRTISGISTTGFFIILALILWLVKFDKPQKEDLPEELEIPVTLDEAPGGGGEGAPADDVPVEAAPSVPSMSLPSATEQTQDATAVPVKKSSQVVNPNGNPEKTEDDLLNDLIKNKKGQVKGNGGTGNDPFGKGDGNGDGDGKGDGTGPGPGGPGFSITGIGNRKLIGYVKAPDNCNRAGVVKLDIVVQPDGRISSMEEVPGYDDDLCLVNRAKNSLRNARFESSGAAKLATGQITITFKQN